MTPFDIRKKIFTILYKDFDNKHREQLFNNLSWNESEDLFLKFIADPTNNWLFNKEIYQTLRDAEDRKREQDLKNEIETQKYFLQEYLEKYSIEMLNEILLKMGYKKTKTYIKKQKKRHMWMEKWGAEQENKGKEQDE